MKKENASFGDDPQKNKLYARQVTLVVVYYVSLLVFFLWFALDFWTDTFTLLILIGFKPEVLSMPIIKLTGFTITGGILGNVLYHIKMLYYYYTYSGSDPKRQYDPRWLGKYFSAPFEGAALALVVLSLLRGGIASFGAALPSTPDELATGSSPFTALGIGALVGFSSRDVIAWIQTLTKTMFVSKEDHKGAG